MTAYDFIFYILAVLTLLPAGVAVFHPNILYAGISLFGSFFGVAGLYVLLAADFLAATQVLIYVGGILILILFAIMLSKNIYKAKFADNKQKYLLPTILGGIALLFILKLIFSTPWNLTLVDELPPPTAINIGNLLLTDYLLPFELASVLLLAALIGAMVLARSK